MNQICDEGERLPCAVLDDGLKTVKYVSDANAADIDAYFESKQTLGWRRVAGFTGFDHSDLGQDQGCLLRQRAFRRKRNSLTYRPLILSLLI